MTDPTHTDKIIQGLSQAMHAAISGAEELLKKQVTEEAKKPEEKSYSWTFVEESLGQTLVRCRTNWPQKDIGDRVRNLLEYINKGNPYLLKEPKQLPHGMVVCHGCDGRIEKDAVKACGTCGGTGMEQEEGCREQDETLDELHQLNGKMSMILTKTANALKGAPGELMSHDWSDLPRAAVAMRAALITLVEAKDLKDKGVASMLSDEEKEKYERKKERGWNMARDVLKGHW